DLSQNHGCAALLLPLDGGGVVGSTGATVAIRNTPVEGTPPVGENTKVRVSPVWLSIDIPTAEISAFPLSAETRHITFVRFLRRSSLSSPNAAKTVSSLSCWYAAML